MRLQRNKTYDITDPAQKTFADKLYQLFSRNISFGHGVDTGDQNIDGKMVNVPNIGPATTDFAVVHNLGRVPLFYDIKSKNAAGDIYKGTTPWTTTTAYFQSTVANLNVTFFIH
jgi:hypothetical protein